ncbi:hypothetical protein THDSLph1_CDS0069 [Terrisporobacter phage TPDSL_ph1]
MEEQLEGHSGVSLLPPYNTDHYGGLKVVEG